MGLQHSRKADKTDTDARSSSSSVACGCGTLERRRLNERETQVQRYVSAVTDRWGGRACSCRRRRPRRPACVCTGYRRVSDACADDRLAAVLRRELDAIVINSDNETSRENGETMNAEVYVLSVAPRPVDGESSTGSRTQEEQQDAAIRLHSHIQVVCGEFRALLLRAPLPAAGAPEPPPHNTARVHTQVDYIHCLVPELHRITACSYYWGKMDRYEAERLLENKPEGTFLLRDSAQEEHLFSVSFRKYGRSLHARIEHCQRQFSFDCHDPAVFSAHTVTQLIEHYKDPACVMFFEPMLTAPLPRRDAFPLQQLARAAIVSRITYDDVERLPLPARMRSYLKEYHYRQSVRVRRLEPDAHYEDC